MKALGPLEIDLKLLENQVTEFEYDLDDAYFGSLEGTLVQEGDVHAKVQIRKISEHFEVRMAVAGVVKVTCDRCLELMDQEVENEGKLTVKFGDAFEEVDDELLILPEMPGTLDLTWYLYELAVLSIPMRHVHPEGGCNEEMQACLEQHSSESDTKTDPRWDVLKNLKNN